MIELILIRHGVTRGNIEKRYLGSTDEKLCQEGIEQLHKKKEDYKESLAEVQQIFLSPMKRCVETAKIFFPDKSRQIIEEYKECHFGDFENKNHQELKGNADYQKFIDSGGRERFPNGESRIQFQERCIYGFEKTIEMVLAEGLKKVALFLHGGTIMSILSYSAFYGELEKELLGDYFDYMCKNGEGYKIIVKVSDKKEIQFTKVERFPNH